MAQQAKFGSYTGIFELKFYCVNRCTYVIFLLVGPQKSLLMIIKVYMKRNFRQ